MIWELLQWLHLANLTVQNQQVLNLNLSNLIFIIYLCSFKRSWHFAMAFFICEVLHVNDYYGALDGLAFDVYQLLFYLIMASVWAACIKERARQSNSKSLQAWCCIMITFLILMALDGFFNTYDETYIYTHYESIILCIHVCIVLSLYKPTAIIDALVGKLRNLTRVLLHNYNFDVVWYTFKQQFTRFKAQ